ncbi:UNVERIFIED_CONTAM: hypothetical protein HDU68_000295 [Siphonaria sp. JEL0065]|nr:hypothetical protein HDU68_000295 [Siphonaria sp. JEL0065]
MNSKINLNTTNANNQSNTFKDTASSARLASIAITVLAQLVPAAATSVSLRRLVAVFVSCSSRASEQRKKALPTTVLTALLIAHRIAKKASSAKAGLSLPLNVKELLSCPCDLMLASLMLAETVLSDSQTSTASWARLVDSNGASTPEGRKKAANLKWTAFEWLEYNATINRDTFMRWCGMIRKWVGDIPVAAASGFIPSVASVQSVPSVIEPITTAIEYSPVPGITNSATPSTSPNACSVPSVSPQPAIASSTPISNSALLTSYLYGLAMGQAVASASLSTTAIIQNEFTSSIPYTSDSTTSATKMLNLNFSLKPPHFSLSCGGGSAAAASFSTASSSPTTYFGTIDHVCRSQTSSVSTSHRLHPYQRIARRGSLQRVI